MSDVRLSLTQRQYMLLMDLVNTVTRALSGISETDISPNSIPATPIDGSAVGTPISEKPGSEFEVNLEPELAVVKTNNTDESMWTTLHFSFDVASIALELYGLDAIIDDDLQRHSIARFVLLKTHVGFKQLSDCAAEANLSLKALAFTSTRSVSSVFRDIIPASEHDGDQM